jgi:hypothetical protein
VCAGAAGAMCERDPPRGHAPERAPTREVESDAESSGGKYNASVVSGRANTPSWVCRGTALPCFGCHQLLQDNFALTHLRKCHKGKRVCMYPERVLEVHK